MRDELRCPLTKRGKSRARNPNVVAPMAYAYVGRPAFSFTQFKKTRAWSEGHQVGSKAAICSAADVTESVVTAASVSGRIFDMDSSTDGKSLSLPSPSTRVVELFNVWKSAASCPPSKVFSEKDDFVVVFAVSASGGMGLDPKLGITFDHDQPLIVLLDVANALVLGSAK